MSHSYASLIPLDRVAGLRPRVWLCVGAGFSREDVKGYLLSRGRGFTQEAVTSLEDLCLKLLSARDPKIGRHRVLGGLARQDVLRLLLAQKAISARMPELKRLRRQGTFFRRLDTAMQAARAAFAHEEEGVVYAERLSARHGLNPIREELQSLCLAYEAWLEGSGLMDPPMLIRKATALLAEEGWPKNLLIPEEIRYFSAKTEESLERAFWDTLSRSVSIQRIGPLPGPLNEGRDEASSAEQTSWDWQLWHTLDDAADALAEELAEQVQGDPQALEDCVVLIPDASNARRSLKRALESRGVALADPRDPTRLRWDEALKWATLPLEVVARGFEREKVISYLRSYLFQEEFPRWVTEISARGIRNGLRSYSGGMLSQVHSFLSELEELFGGRKSCDELSEAHLKFLREAIGTQSDRLWILPFFESLWKDFSADTLRVGQGHRRAPLLYWWERLQARIAEMPSPVERAKSELGIATYRLHQAPLTARSRIYVLGLPANWLSGEGVGDYWFSERDRETLSSEFAVRSGLQIRQERLAALRAWLRGSAESGTQSVVWLDAMYDPDGRERETIEAVLRELASSLGLPEEVLPSHPAEKGSYPRWSRSYGALRPLPPQSVQLAPLAAPPDGALPEITATAIDSYSRCGFQALAYHRWKLKNSREPDAEAWPEARGNILHEAVKFLLASRDEEGNFTLDLSEALDQAWKAKSPKGMVRSARSEKYTRARMLQVLRTFSEKEREYFSRAPSKTVALDDTRLRLELPSATIVGTPDRIDAHADGLFVIDYKTSSALPHGCDMVEMGYRLQLPFYALAAAKQFKKSVLGVQFVELNRKGARGSGIFFKKYNGKDSGKPTNLRSNSKSLLAIDPDEAWSKLQEQLELHAQGYVGGRFEARPKRKDKECSTCGVADFCGFRRLSDDAEDAHDGA